MAEGKKVFTLKDVSSHDFVVEYAQHLKKTGKMDVPGAVPNRRLADSSVLQPRRAQCCKSSDTSSRGYKPT